MITAKIVDSVSQLKLFNSLKIALRPRGLRSYLNQLNNPLKVLDVGCGNGSSIFIKSILTNVEIYGVDICDYNQTEQSKQLYKRYIIAEPERFSKVISELGENFDLIISNHNIEHCNDPKATFIAMIERLLPNGDLFIATPSLCSVGYPRRSGTLNFFDDPTHKTTVNLEDYIYTEQDQLDCIFYSRSYKPLFWWAVGFASEFISKKRNKVMLGTWDYYGFEQILWAKKRA